MEGRVTGWDVFLGALAYVPVLNLVAIVRRTKSRFVVFHTRQGLYLISVLGGLFVLFALAFYLFLNVVPWGFGQKLFAVLVVMDVVAYAVLVVLMIGAVAQRRMTMLPILGELAGER